jgi:3-carboxy-cis,cis-muconate cycloisomerase
MRGPLYQWAVTSTAADDPFSDDALIRAMLRFETALAGAQAKLGLIPPAAAAAISQHAASLTLDPAQLGRDGAEAGSLAIPVVAALTAQVAAHDESAARYVHLGATSQDVIDTAMALCAKAAVGRLDFLLQRASRAARQLAQQHAATPVLARTLLQPAAVVTIGWKCAQWALSLARVRRRLLRAGVDALAVSLGGAVGDLAAYGNAGAALRAEMAGVLGLHDPGATWHTRREDWIALAADAALACGAMAKIARDVALMAQAELGEVAESVAPGRGSSSAMPHKRNPVLTMRVLAATQAVPGMMASLLAAMPHEHERALGNWQAELAQYPQVLLHTLAGAGALAELLEGLRIDPARCRANLDALQGTLFSERLAALLIPMLGRAETQALVASLCQQAMVSRTHLRELARERLGKDPRTAGVAVSELDAAFDVDAAAQASAQEVARMLDSLNNQKR